MSTGGSRATRWRGGGGGSGALTVTGANDAPLASDDGQTTDEDTALAAAVPAASDVDGVIASYALVGGGAQGVLSFAAAGSYAFDPNGEVEDLAGGAQQV